MLRAQNDTKKADTRCNSRLDAGMTKANLMKETSHICIHFARGNCTRGPDCNYYHRVPNDLDEARLDPMHDVFGRGVLCAAGGVCCPLG